MRRRPLRMTERLVLEPLMGEWVSAANEFEALRSQGSSLTEVPSGEVLAAARACILAKGKWMDEYALLRRGASRPSADKAFYRMVGQIWRR